MTEKLELQAKEIGALKEIVLACVSRTQRDDMPVLGPLQMKAITDMLRPELLTAVRHDMQPSLASAHQDITKMLSEHANEVRGTLTASLDPTARSVEAISAWVERIRNPASSGQGAAGANAVPPASANRTIQQGPHAASR